jgi:simple sugar transport system permease protein
MNRRGDARWLIAAATVLATAGAVLIILMAGGYDTPRALAALWNGAFGSSYAVLSATMVRATPLLFVGLAVGVAFRAGVLNIGAEGQLLAGAAAAVAVGLATGALPRIVALPLVLGAGMLAGAAWAGMAAAVRRA